jgi:hypothetical protein
MEIDIKNYNDYKENFSKIFFDFIKDNNYNFTFKENEIINMDKLNQFLIQIYLPLNNHDNESKKMKQLKLFSGNLMSSCNKEEQIENINILNQLLLHALFFQDKKNITKINLEERFNTILKSFEIKFKKFKYYNLRLLILQKIPILKKEDIKIFTYNSGNFYNSIKMFVQMLNINLFNLNFYNCYQDELLNKFLEVINNLNLKEEKIEEKEVKNDEKEYEKEENEDYENSILNKISNSFLNILINISTNKNINEDDKLFLDNLLDGNKNLKSNEYKLNKIDIEFIKTFSKETFEMIIKYLIKKNKIKFINKININKLFTIIRLFI